MVGTLLIILSMGGCYAAVPDGDAPVNGGLLIIGIFACMTGFVVFLVGRFTE
jgi:hypothetical protein